jgi:pyruvate/2-oxoglutarate dehydrogenase complex dihydrolipoamide dehydrogenase (E3) component
VRTLEESDPASAAIVGAGYIGLEMAEGLRTRGLAVTQFERLPEVLPTVDPGIGALVNATLAGHGVDVRTSTTVQHIARAPAGSPGRLQVDATDGTGNGHTTFADLVLVVVGVRPDTQVPSSERVGPSVWTAGCAPVSAGSSPPGTASRPITA